MGATIKVRVMVQEMDVLGPGFTVYLNRGTGEFVTLSEEEVEALDTEDPEGVPEWMQEYLPKLREARESADYFALPDSFDIHEWEIMRSFAVSVSSADASDDLLHALHGKVLAFSHRLSGMWESHAHHRSAHRFGLHTRARQ